MAGQRDLDLLCVGETMGLVVAERPGPLSGDVSLAVGGAESNVAIAAARLGARVAWVTRLGADPIGDLVARAVRGEGVEVHAERDHARPTGLMVKERRTPQHTRVVYYRAGSAASALGPELVPDGLLSRARILHVTGITPALSAGAADALRSIVVRARDTGTLVSYDINHRSRLWSGSDAGRYAREILPHVDILFGGLDELALLDPALGDEHRVAEVAATLGVEEVVIKLGDRGAMAVARGERASVSAYAVTVVDTVGAGDAFVGGYLSAVIEGASLGERLDRAARCGALQCTVSGDWEGSPTLEELALLDGGDAVSR
jgi:2-dehydro-3-deoxygluconokinase